jgi:catechol 2,3-dioxygenase-like lactoylglutathione lyase family enzyme
MGSIVVGSSAGHRLSATCDECVSGLGQDDDMTELATDPSTDQAGSRPAISLDLVVLDTNDPPRLASFYNALLGWETEREEEDWITITGGPGARLAFQLAINHKPPTWPDNAIPQQGHLDLHVDDLAAAAAYAESLGARRAGGAREGFVVFLDPSGHPFCLCD